jgi:hypothetical protein
LCAEAVLLVSMGGSLCEEEDRYAGANHFSFIPGSFVLGATTAQPSGGDR